MSTTNKDAALKIKQTMDVINTKYGDGTIFMAGSGLFQLTFTSTGLPDVDRILGGGVPDGKVIMLYGPEGAGKSSFCMHVMSKYAVSAYIDAERSLTMERAAVFGVDVRKVIVVQPMHGEQALSSVISLAEAGVKLIVVDSVAALVPRKEFELEENTEQLGGIALTAGLLTRKIFALNNVCHRTGTSVIFINQVRDKFGAMAFGEQTTLPGGHALKHACHVIMKIARKETLKVSDEALGIMCRISTSTKNRSASPFQEADVPLIFDKGFVSLEVYKQELKEARKRSLSRSRQQLGDVLREDN
jgi:recombination protein RecA